MPIEPGETSVEVTDNGGPSNQEAHDIADLDFVAAEANRHCDEDIEERCRQQRLQNDSAEGGMVESSDFAALAKLAKEETRCN
jgi:hypothetical protein